MRDASVREAATRNAIVARLTEAGVWSEHALRSEVLCAFGEDVTLRLIEAQMASGRGDMLSVSRAAHAIRLVASDVGAESLRSVACALEAVARRGDTPSSVLLLHALEAEIARARRAVTMLA
jgi:hypothetical protein